ncbi:160_t:CDS:2 [Ambispora gerdemannii]|uniref:160_t:CDS:1 n=1 Tax=Ambispora gerdemannii TaxID=144530 RepID=A0A9N9GWJ5_9GLOM|nr:160_t:CDS:2 [Ambispora gerdemannii]
MKSSLIILLLFASFVFAVPVDKRLLPNINPASCNGFRITSPTVPYYSYTEGQCYQISFDKGASSVVNVTTVDLFKGCDNTLVARQFTGKVDVNTQIATPYFNLEFGDLPTADYYYSVTALTADGGTCTFITVPFEGIADHVNPPAQCPKYPPS